MRNFEQTIEYLYKQLPAFQDKGKKAIKVGLTNISFMCKKIGNPHLNYPTIHVAGTNGKGSVSNMLASILTEAGYKVGLYTSPHLLDFRERIRVCPHMIEKDFVVDFVRKIEPEMSKIQASFFEITQAMAFDYFADQKVDVAVIETGLGGRLDATNIIQPLLSIITNVGLDHTDILGDSVSKIAYEKAGIIKPNTPVLVGKRQLDTEAVFAQVAEKNNAKLFYATQYEGYQSSLKGEYQKENIATVVAACQLLKFKRVGEKQIRDGLMKVNQNTGLRGRWECLNNGPLVVCDTGHNLDAWKFLAPQIAAQQAETKRMVIGFVSDKDVQKILDCMDTSAEYYFCSPSVERALSIEKLKPLSEKFNAQYFSTVEEAYLEAYSDSGKNDFIFIGGSTFVVADALKNLSIVLV